MRRVRLTGCGVALVFGVVIAFELPAQGVAGPKKGPSPSRFSPPAFSPGTWQGTLTFAGGTSAPGVNATTISGGGTFTFIVTPAGGISGGSSLTLDETLVVAPNASGYGAHGTVTGTVPVLGTSIHIVTQGNVDLLLHFDEPGLGDLSSTLPAVLYLDPVKATCGKVSGDAGTVGRAYQQGAGLSTTTTAIWSAVRTHRDAPDDAEVKTLVAEATTEMDRYFQSHTSLTLTRSANSLQALAGAVAANAACNHALRGFSRGLLGNSVLAPLVKRLYRIVLPLASAVDDTSLIALAETAHDLGLQGSAGRLEDALAQHIASAPSSLPLGTDRAGELTEILDYAQAYGLSSLASAAQTALAALTAGQ